MQEQALALATFFADVNLTLTWWPLYPNLTRNRMIYLPSTDKVVQS